VDDLDRCLEGRNVRVLEAIQLIVAISGAPVIVFMAIDSRVVVASIEATVNKSLNIYDALITGWEYMDKIVQLPFCIPEPPVEKVRRLVMSCVDKAVAVRGVAEQLRTLKTSLMKNNKVSDNNIMLAFREELEQLKVKNTNDEEFSNHVIIYASDFIAALGKPSHDEDLIINAAKAMTLTTNNGLELMKSIPEGLEILCQRVNFALFHIKIYAVTVDNIVETDEHKDNNAFEHKDNNAFEHSASKKGQTAIILDDSNSSKEYIQEEQPLLKKKYKFKLDKSLEPFKLSKEESSSVSSYMMNAMEQCAPYCDSNPRRLKRIVNVLQVISEVSKCKPLSELKPERKLRDDPRWNDFSMKLVKWIYLCESFPYRTSFLVHILTDFDQKSDFNEISDEIAADEKTDETIDDNNKELEELFFYKKHQKDENEAFQVPFQVPLNEEESIFKTFYRHVDKFIHNIKSSEKLSRLDGDPEVFSIFLMSLIKKPLADKKTLTITCKDILGPLDPANQNNKRDLNFSLLSYSYNLNPSMCHQIGLEMDELVSDYQICDRNNNSSASMHKRSIIRKQELFSKTSRDLEINSAREERTPGRNINL